MHAFTTRFPPCWAHAGEVEAYQHARAEARKLPPPQPLERPQQASHGTTGASAMVTRPLGGSPAKSMPVAGAPSGLLPRAMLEEAGSHGEAQSTVPRHLDPFQHGYVMELTPAERDALYAQERRRREQHASTAAGQVSKAGAGTGATTLEVAAARHAAKTADARNKASVARASALRASHIFNADDPWAQQAASSQGSGYELPLPAAERAAAGTSADHEEAVQRYVSAQQRQAAWCDAQAKQGAGWQPRRSGKGAVRGRPASDIFHHHPERKGDKARRGRSLGSRSVSSVDPLTGRSLGPRESGDREVRESATPHAHDTLMLKAAAAAAQPTFAPRVNAVGHAVRPQDRGVPGGATSARDTAAALVSMASSASSPLLPAGRRSLGGVQAVTPGTASGGVTGKPTQVPSAVARAAAAAPRTVFRRGGVQTQAGASHPPALSGVLPATTALPAGLSGAAVRRQLARESLRGEGSDSATGSIGMGADAPRYAGAESLRDTLSRSSGAGGWGEAGVPPTSTVSAASQAGTSLGVTSHSAYWGLRQRGATRSADGQLVADAAVAGHVQSPAESAAKTRKERSAAMRASNIPFVLEGQAQTAQQRAESLLSTSAVSQRNTLAAVRGEAAASLLASDPVLPTTRRTAPAAAQPEPLLQPKPWALSAKAAEQTVDIVTHTPLHPAVQQSAQRQAQKLEAKAGRLDDPLHAARTSGLAAGARQGVFNPETGQVSHGARHARAVAVAGASAQYDVITGQRKTAPPRGSPARSQAHTAPAPLGTAPGLRPPTPTAPDYLQHVKAQ